MCSWCWAYAPIQQQICRALSHQLPIVDILGGLAADTDAPMPEALQKQIQGHWRCIEQEVGTEFNFNFWSSPEITPRRSTYPACRAVIAAGMQGGDAAMAAMTEAIQHAYYLRAMNPSEEDTLLQLADELELDFQRFMQDLAGTDAEEILQQQIQFTQSLPVSGFPSWVLVIEQQAIAIPVDYHSAQTTLARITDQIKLAMKD